MTPLLLRFYISLAGALFYNIVLTGASRVRIVCRDPYISCVENPLGGTQVVLGVVFRHSTTASKPLKRRPAIIGSACAGLNCRVNARKSPTL